MGRGHRFKRVLGEEAVLAGLERLGRKPRNLENLIEAGFPRAQIEEACYWHSKEAGTRVEKIAAQNMAQGLFEDESLLGLFDNYFGCTGWKLESSPWFYSKDDYRRCFKAIIKSIEFHIVQLDQGGGAEHWGAYFLRLPYDLGMAQALHSLWEEICLGEYYWSAQQSYAHLRAANILDYLHKNLDIINFSEHAFSYNWERNFRRRFLPALRLFEEVLERAVRRWEEKRRKKSTRKFHYRAFSAESEGAETVVLKALTVFGMEPATASLSNLQRSFRRLSKKAHPDQGGAPEDFRRLSQYKEIVESWLKNSRMS